MKATCPSPTVRHLLLIASACLVIFLGIRPASSQVTEPPTSPSRTDALAAFAGTPTPTATTCRPGTGWMWTTGPAKPETASQVQRTLKEMGIEASVAATAFGETDSCGNFSLYAIDFTVTLSRQFDIPETAQRQTADVIYPVLAKFGKPNLGNVRITLGPSSTIVLPSSSALTRRPSASALSANWQQITTLSSPQGRYTHGLAYDSDRRVAILFGGDSTGSSRLNDTWEYDGTNWRQIAPAQSPAGRANIDQTLVYDSNRKKTVLFGGLGTSGYLGDTWEYNGTTWSQISPSPSPPNRDSHAMTFDSYRGVTILFGGYGSSGTRLNDTWEYNGTWHQVSPAQSPGGRLHHALAYDTRRHVAVLFGGVDSANTKLGDTWEYDGANWHRITPAQSPSARENHSMAFDSARGVVVLFGGTGNSGRLNETWEYDGTNWQPVATTQSPAARTEMSLAYDSQRGKVVFFVGGYWGTGLTVFTETWEYTATSTPPPGGMNKKVYVIVYDPLLSNGQKLSAYLHWNDHAALTQGTIDFFKQVTNNRLTYSVAFTTIVTDGWPEKIDGFRYTEATYLAVINGQTPAHQPDNVDYTKIVNSPQFDICGKVNRGEIDEVWIYNGPGFGFWESTLVGPGAYWYNSPPVPGVTACNRLVPIMGPSPERGLECATENFGHRTESTMTRVYASWQQNRTTHNWEKFALVKALSPSYSYSGCGNIHYPPNGTKDYEYGNSSTARSNCADFANYPNLGDPSVVAQPVTSL